MLSAPVIFGCAGAALSADERRFFSAVNPVGLILFARNCESPEQIRSLIDDFRDAVHMDDPLVLIDQEGGRVQRLGPPHWPAYPSAGRLANLAAVEPAMGFEAARLLGRLLASDLEPLGITVNCAPVLDILRPETHQVIGDRAFGTEPEQVARMGRALCEGLLSGGVLPVIKHVPGHGRSRADSHLELPVVTAALEDLAATDFETFRRLRDMPLAMTAHVVFTAIDPDRPATTSPQALRRAVRGHIGFGGLLMSDDLGMKALSGGMDRRARDAQRAGCDLIVHCSGDMAEMERVADGVRRMSRLVGAWLDRANLQRRRTRSGDAFDADEGRASLARMLAHAEGAE